MWNRQSEVAFVKVVGKSLVHLPEEGFVEILDTVTSLVTPKEEIVVVRCLRLQYAPVVLDRVLVFCLFRLSRLY